MDSQPLKDKVAVITGAGRGIGYGIARRFATEGAHIVIPDIDFELAQSAAERIAEETGVRTLALQCNVADRESVDRMIEAVVSEFGSVDIMVANAGVVAGLTVLETDQASWQRTIDINLTGAFNSAQAAAKKMVEQGTEGRLIFITSLAAIIPDRNQVEYAASKSGVKMMMSVMAQDLGKYGITANAIAPGIIYTDMGKAHWDIPANREAFEKTNPVPRLGTPDDIAAAAVFLASEDASYITGTTIRVDGGRYPIG